MSTLMLINKARMNLLMIAMFWLSPIIFLLLNQEDTPLYFTAAFILLSLFVLAWALGAALKSMPQNNRSIMALELINGSTTEAIKLTLKHFIKIGATLSIILAAFSFTSNHYISLEQATPISSDFIVYLALIGWAISIAIVTMRSAKVAKSITN